MNKYEILASLFSVIVLTGCGNEQFEPMEPVVVEDAMSASAFFQKNGLTSTSAGNVDRIIRDIPATSFRIVAGREKDGQTLWLAKFDSTGKELWHYEVNLATDEHPNLSGVDFFNSLQMCWGAHNSEFGLAAPWDKCLLVAVGYEKESVMDVCAYIFTLDFASGQEITAPLLNESPNDVFPLHKNNYLYMRSTEHIYCFKNTGVLCWHRKPLGAEVNSGLGVYNKFIPVSDEVIVFPNNTNDYLQEGFRVVNLKNYELIFEVPLTKADLLEEGQQDSRSINFYLTNAYIQDGVLYIAYDRRDIIESQTKDPVTGQEHTERSEITIASYRRTYSYPQGVFIDYVKL